MGPALFGVWSRRERGDCMGMDGRTGGNESDDDEKEGSSNLNAKLNK